MCDRFATIEADISRGGFRTVAIALVFMFSVAFGVIGVISGILHIVITGPIPSLLLFFGPILAISSILLFVIEVPSVLLIDPVVVLAMVFALSILYFFIGYGLWKMRRWSTITLLILCAGGLMSVVLAPFDPLFAANSIYIFPVVLVASAWKHLW